MKMENIRFFQSDELTHLRCLIDLATSYNINVQVAPPRAFNAKIYAEGMGLFKGFDLPGMQFPNGANSTYIPLSKINSDRNDFLFCEFQKIFEHMHLPSSVIPDLCLAFTELADNIYYHSGATDNSGWGYIAAQVFRNRVQMSFTDTGVGFESAYKRSGTDKDRSNSQLLLDSLNYLESRFNIPGKKATRGIGLHEASKLIKDTSGSLILRSFDGMVSLSKGGITKASNTNWVFHGTQVSMEVPI